MLKVQIQTGQSEAGFLYILWSCKKLVVIFDKINDKQRINVSFSLLLPILGDNACSCPMRKKDSDQITFHSETADIKKLVVSKYKTLDQIGYSCKNKLRIFKALGKC